MKTSDLVEKKAVAVHNLLRELGYPFTLEDVKNNIKQQLKHDCVPGEVSNVIRAVLRLSCSYLD